MALKNGIFLYSSIIETIMDLADGDETSAGEALLAVTNYAYYGREYTGDNQIARVALYNFKPLKDRHETRVNAGRKGGLAGGGGAPKGNQNARKHWDSDCETIANNSKTIAKEASFQNNSKQLYNSKQKQNNSNNSLNNSELQGVQTIANNSDISMMKTGRLDNTSPLTELVLSNRGKEKEKEKEKEKSVTTAPAPSHGRAVVPPPVPRSLQSESADSQAPQAHSQLPPPPAPSPERSCSRLTEAEIARQKARMKASLDPELTANIRASYERGHAESEAAFRAKLSGDCPEDAERLGAAKPPETDKEHMNALKKANNERIMQLARMEDDPAERARILAVIGRKTL